MHLAHAQFVEREGDGLLHRGARDPAAPRSSIAHHERDGSGLVAARTHRHVPDVPPIDVDPEQHLVGRVERGDELTQLVQGVGRIVPNFEMAGDLWVVEPPQVGVVHIIDAQRPQDDVHAEKLTAGPGCHAGVAPSADPRSDVADPLELDVTRAVVSPEGLPDLTWPVSRKAMFDLGDQLLRSYLAVHRGHPEEEAFPTALPAVWYVGEVVAAFEAHTAATHAELRAPQRLRLFHALARGEEPPRDPFIGELLAGPRHSAPWRRSVRQLKWAFRTEPFAIRRLRSVDLVEDVVAVHTGELLSEHARRLGLRPRLVLYEDIFGALDEGIGPPAASRTFIAEILDATADAFTAAGEALPPHLVRYFRSWLELAAGAVAARVGLLLSAGPGLPRRLWVGTAASTWGRIFAYAVQRAGGEVTAHDHGTGSGHRANFPKAVGDYVACDRFVTFNETQAAALRAQVDPAYLTMRSTPPIISTLPASGTAVPRAPAPVRSVDVVRRVMVATAFFRGDRNGIHAKMADPVALDWHARLLAELGRAGFEVLHKPHPSGPRPPARLYEVTGAIPVEDPFEDVALSADVVLIADEPGTTVLRSAMELGAPLVVADHSLHVLTTEARGLLEQRCPVIDGWTDERGRSQLDMPALLDAVRAAPERTSPAFYETYFAIR